MKEGWMKNDEWWRMNDEGWWFQAVEGFWLMTDRQTDIYDCRVAFVTEKYIASFLTFSLPKSHLLDTESESMMQP